MEFESSSESNVPDPEVDQLPAVLVDAEISTSVFKQAEFGMLTVTVAGSKMVTVEISLTKGQGPVPSGSSVVHVRMIS